MTNTHLWLASDEGVATVQHARYCTKLRKKKMFNDPSPLSAWVAVT